MWEQKYDIVLKTPVGPRYGTMEVHQEQGELDGFFNVLMEKNRFHGSVDEGNHCEITGNLKTLMRTVVYSASGEVTKESICLRMNVGNDVLEVNGTALTKEKEVRL